MNITKATVKDAIKKAPCGITIDNIVCGNTWRVECHYVEASTDWISPVYKDVIKALRKLNLSNVRCSWLWTSSKDNHEVVHFIIEFDV